MTDLPPEVRRLLWDVDPDALDRTEHRDLVIERVMSRGTYAAMQWLLREVSASDRCEFLRRRGDRLSPRDEAYWRLVSGDPLEVQRPGGGRPTWLT